MPIPFPKMHIAQSVINRILNTIEGEESLSMTAMQPPIPPDPTVEGVTLDGALSKPPEQTAVPPEQEDAANQGMLENSVMGGSPFDGALVGASGAETPPAGMFG
jgi:hypothetical protein